MTLEHAMEIVAEVRKDLKNGIKVGLAEEALNTLANALENLHEDIANTCEERADWEFRNHPENPACRKIAEELAGIIRQRSKYNRITT